MSYQVQFYHQDLDAGKAPPTEVEMKDIATRTGWKFTPEYPDEGIYLADIDETHPFIVALKDTGIRRIQD